jgi:hypothetical protein
MVPLKLIIMMVMMQRLDWGAKLLQGKTQDRRDL